MNTVGYGDVTPQNDVERIFCIFFIYAACGIFAYTLNVVGFIIQQFKKNKSQFLQNVMIINEYMNKKNINFDLRIRIRKYLEYVWMEEQYRNSEEENAIIDKLSYSLKEELIMETNGKILREIPFFGNSNFSEKTLKKIVFKLKEFHYMPGDIIYQRGDHFNNFLYILWKGEAELFMDIFNKDDNCQWIQKIEKAKTFGEKEFIIGCEKEASAKSTSFSTVFVLNFDEFISILLENMEDYTKFIEIKHNASLYNNYLNVHINCGFCFDLNHSITECPFLHLKVSPQRVIQKYCYYNPNERVAWFRKKKKYNALNKQKFYQFVAQTIQQEHIFSEESEMSENVANSSSARIVLDSNNEKKNAFNNLSEFDEAGSEEIISDSNYKIIMQKDICVKTNPDRESTKVNEIKLIDSKSSSVDFEEINKNVHDLNHKTKVLNSKKITSVNSLKIPNVNEKKEKENQKNLVEIEKNVEIDLIQIFEKKMDYENYFPHNNSENIIRLYNQAMERNPFHLTKKTRRNLGRRGILSPSKISKLFSSNFKKEFDNFSPTSKKIPFHQIPFIFNKFDEISLESKINLDRKAIIKLLNTKKKDRKRNIFVRLIRCLINVMKEN